MATVAAAQNLWNICVNKIRFGQKESKAKRRRNDDALSIESSAFSK